MALDKKKKKPLLPASKSKTLTRQEVESLREPLIAAIIDDLGYLDEYIWWRCQDAEHVPVWSDIDRDEAAILAKLLLRGGERSPRTAATVRAIVDGSDYVSALMITIPRTVKMVQRLKQAPKRERAPRKERLARMREG